MRNWNMYSNKFPKYHMKILLGDVSAKVSREDIFKPSVGNENLHEISNDNGVRVVSFSTSTNLVIKSTMFPHHNIHKCTWMSPDGFAALEDLDAEDEISTVWETIRENIKMPAKESLYKI
jgi:hypothetical protein